MPTHGSLTKAGKVRGQTPKWKVVNVLVHRPAFETKVTSRNDLSLLEYLVKINLEEEDVDADYTNF